MPDLHGFGFAPPQSLTDRSRPESAARPSPRALPARRGRNSLVAPRVHVLHSCHSCRCGADCSREPSLPMPTAPHTTTHDNQHSNYQPSNHNPHPKSHQIISRLRALWSLKAFNIGAMHTRPTNRNGENDRPDNDNRPDYEREPLLHTCSSPYRSGSAATSHAPQPRPGHQLLIIAATARYCILLATVRRVSVP